MESKNEGKVQDVSLDEKDVKKSYWLWQFFSHANYNYERMQGTAVANYQIGRASCRERV